MRQYADVFVSKKCSNCGGDNTANYRGCPVYKELKIGSTKECQQNDPTTHH